MERALFTGNREPNLDELFADPAIHRLMARDGTSESEARALLQRVAAQRQTPPKLQFSNPRLDRPPAEPPNRAPLAIVAAANTPPRWPRVFPSL